MIRPAPKRRKRRRRRRKSPSAARDAPPARGARPSADRTRAELVRNDRRRLTSPAAARANCNNSLMATGGRSCSLDLGGGANLAARRRLILILRTSLLAALMLAGAADLIECRRFARSDMQPSPPPTVQTRGARFRGLQLDESLVAFLGIRYASPPIKRLRFMPPTGYHYSADRTHDAQQLGPICIQRVPPLALAGRLMPRASFAYLRPLLARLSELEQSEDCLNLNIYAPLEAINSRQHQLPVLVIIHGESLDFGAGATIDGQRIARHQPSATKLVVVTFNYRLNLLGFPPKLMGATRGNLGLMDQVAALHWIKDNVAAFGGAPSNITIMGTKRAATFVNLLMLSPLARGLFHRAVMEDGAALSPMLLAAAQPAVQHLRLLARMCDCPVYLAEATNASARLQRANQLADEAKSNALTLECLRQRPAELLSQRLPLDQLAIEPQSGELLADARWLQSLEVLAPGELRAENASASMLPIGGARLREVLAVVEERELTRVRAAPLDDLGVSSPLGAIYGPSTASARPLFGLVVDGTMVLEEELASQMLRAPRESPFGQRDLLVGLTRPVLTEGIGESDINSDLGPDSPLFERFGRQLEQSGLSNEQALALVNLFVRSSYKYHNQEIANSIISHYLSSLAARHLAKMRKSRPSAAEDSAKLAGERQLLVLGVLVGAFQDALVNTPLVKTALIHSTRQLEPLADAFVGETFQRWRAKSANTSTPAETPRGSPLEQFASFARSLLTDASWPPEPTSTDDYPSVARTDQRPRSTYLYQLDPSALVKLTRRLADRVQRTHASRTMTPTSGWYALHEMLLTLAADLEAPESASRFRALRQPSLACSSELDDSAPTGLGGRLSEWMCRRFSALVGSFAATGRPTQVPEFERTGETVGKQVAEYEDKCLGGQPAVERGDHHSVQAAPAEERESCRRMVDGIALSLITEQLAGGAPNWRVFSVFSQEVATLPGLGERETGGLWEVSAIQDASQVQFDEKLSFVSRAAFWSNFVPALNCTKTQPVMPSSLLAASSSIFGEANNQSISPLLNLNLKFDCQTGAETPLSLVEGLVGSVEQRLSSMKSVFAAQRNASPQAQQSLRMANVRQTNETETSTDQFQLDSAPTHSQLDDRVLAHNATESWTARLLAASQRRLHPVLLLCGLVACLTLISGAYAVAKRRRSRSKVEHDAATEPPDATVSTPCHAGLERELEDNRLAASLETSNEPTTAPDGHPQPRAEEAVRMVDSPLAQYWEAEQSVLLQQVAASQHFGSLCRSHSTLAGAATRNQDRRFVAGDGPESFVNLVASDGRQDPMPIMLPIVAADADQQVGSLKRRSRASSESRQLLNGRCTDDIDMRSYLLPSDGYVANPKHQRRRLNGCLANHSAGSAQSSSFASSSTPTNNTTNQQSGAHKKRVKISDPLGGAHEVKRSANRSLLSSSACGDFEVPSFCPVHSGSQLLISDNAAEHQSYVQSGAEQPLTLYSSSQIDLLSGLQYADGSRLIAMAPTGETIAYQEGQPLCYAGDAYLSAGYQAPK